MNTKYRIAKQEKLSRVLNVIIVVITCILAIMAIRMIMELRDAKPHKYQAEYLGYLVETKYYDSLVDCYYQNIALGHGEDEELKEYYGIARYYEAAFLYKAYLYADDEEEAALYYDKMKQAEEDMGEWIIMKGPINSKIGLVE